MKFIKLTTDKNEIVYINMSTVTEIYNRDIEKRGSCIFFNYYNDCYNKYGFTYVKETPEEIIKLIKE